MSWLALLLAASVGTAAPAHHVPKHGRLAKQAPRHKGVKLTRTAPPVPAAPVAGGGGPALDAPAAPTPAPTPAPALPSRTRVVLQDDPYSLQSSYIALKAGPVEFNVVNAGMDDHDLSIRGTSSTVFAPAGQEVQLATSLAPGTYRLYCSLPGHEQLGMWTALTVK